MKPSLHPSSESMRLAYIVHGFDFGGLERCVANLVNHLDRDRFEPHIVSLTTIGDARKWIVADHVQFKDLRKVRGNDLGVYHRLASYLREVRIDLMHSHNWGTLLETAVASKWTGVPFVHAEHGLDFGRTTTGIKARIRGRLRRWGMSQAVRIVPIAACVHERLSETAGVPGSKIALIRNGVSLPEGLGDVSFRDKTRSRLGIGHEDVVFGSIGRLCDVKGFDLAIQAMEMVCTRRTDCHMILVGDGPDRNKLDTLIASSGLSDRIHLVGAQTNIGAWLGTMDAFFNSSRSEAMNLAILEAMAAGLATVAMDVGDNHFLLTKHGAIGFVVPSGDVNAFANQLENMARDPGLRREMGRQAIDIYRREYTVESMVHRYSELYQDVLSPSS